MSPLRLAILSALLVSSVPLAANASDSWGPLFTIPYASQILGAPADAFSATVASVAGINAGDEIIVTANDDNEYLRRVVSVDTVLRLVTWTPSLPLAARTNSFIRSSFTVDPDPAKNGERVLLAPKQSAVDAAGNVYILDKFNNRVVAVDKNGSVLWTFGGYARIYDDSAMLPADRWGLPCDNQPTPACPNDPQAMLGRFFQPLGIDVSADGQTLIVGDTWNHRVEVFTEDDVSGTIVPVAIHNGITAPRFSAFAIGGYGSDVGQLNSPSGVGLSATGSIAAADEFNQRIEIFTPIPGSNHQFTAVAVGHYGPENPSTVGDVNFNDPEDVKFDRSANATTSGRIVIADADNHRVQVLNPSGGYIVTIGSGPSSDDGLFDTPLGVTIDDTGRIYVVDTHNSRIQVFRAAGISAYELESVFGTEQTAQSIPGLLPLIGPTGAGFGLGRLVITEQGGERLQVLGRGSLAVETVTPTLPSGHTSLRPQEAGNDTVDVAVVVRNTGVVNLTGITLSATSSHPGAFVTSPTSGSSELAPAGTPGDSATFHFTYRVTSLNFNVSTLHFTLSATGLAGPVVTSSTSDVDTGIAVVAPNQGALAIGTVTAVTSAGSDRAGIGDTITVTVPVRSIGNVPLANVVTTVTLSSPNLVSLSTVAGTPAFLGDRDSANASASVTFSFIAQAAGTVTFTATATSPDLPGGGAPGTGTTAPNTPSIVILSDSTPPTIDIALTPLPNLPSADGKRWYNGAPRTIVGGVEIITWPTIQVTARDNNALKALGWRMVTTSSPEQPDHVGSCSAAAPNSVAPSSCVAGPAGSLIWTRTLTNMQKRIVIAFWAEDEAGNGKATIDEQQACGDMPESVLVQTIGNVVCVDIHIDIDPPTITQDAITFESDNAAAHIAFTGDDRVSLVGSITSPNGLLRDGLSTGELVLQTEGPAVTGSVILIDFAGNSATFTLPLPGMPSLRLDHTPPEAFNRLDPAALGRQCTTTIDGRPVNYFCTNKVYGTDNLPGLTTAAFAPIGVVRTKWGHPFDDDNRDGWDGRKDDDAHHRAHREVRDGDDRDGDDDARDWDGQSAELQTYSFTDAFIPDSGPAPIQNPNRVTLVEEVRQSGNEARVRVMSYRYVQGSTPGPVIIPERANKKYEWSTNPDGSLRSLTQKFELRTRRDRVQVIASFDARRNVTSISRFDSGETRVTAPGLILLRMTTSKGALTIDYDINAPVPVPDLGPPALTVPPPLVVEATSAAGATASFAASATDAIDGHLAAYCTPQSGGTFPLGATTIECNATDAAGNVAARTFTITVRDTTGPTLTLPGTIAVTAASPSGTNLTFSATAVDLIDGARPVHCTPSSGSKFKVGTTSVSCSASDTSGNTTTGSFSVIVKRD